MCPDCMGCKTNFDAYGVEYEFKDINASLKDLKQFLIYRDTEKVFEKWKAIHDIGIPCIVSDDGTVFTDWEGYLKERGMEPIELDSGEACSLDHKGC